MASGELLGAIGVVVTLVYLPLQIRQNTRGIRKAQLHALTDSFNWLNVALAENERLASRFAKDLADYDSLDGNQRV